MKPKRIVQPLSFQFYYVPMLLTALAGLGVSLYLGVSHYRVYTDIGYSSFCAISKAINCDTVSQSPYSIFLEMPIPFWGIFGYVLFIALSGVAGTPAFRPRRLWRLLFLLTLLYSLISVVLALISSFSIRSYCIMCIATYAVNFILAFYTWLIARRFDSSSFFRGLKEDLIQIAGKKSLFAGLTVGWCLLLLFFWILLPTYWEMDTPSSAKALAHGTTEDGYPWIGAETPELTIVEFSDYQCFQCKKMHFHLRSLITKHPDRIRLVHRHYPMDHNFNPIVKEPFHQVSGIMALLAIQAGFNQKFWEANDELFKLGQSIKTIDTSELADTLNMEPQSLARALDRPEALRKLNQDIRDGMRLGIAGTPTFVIDGKVYESQIPLTILQNAIR